MILVWYIFKKETVLLSISLESRTLLNGVDRDLFAHWTEFRLILRHTWRALTFEINFIFRPVRLFRSGCNRELRRSPLVRVSFICKLIGEAWDVIVAWTCHVDIHWDELLSRSRWPVSRKRSLGRVRKRVVPTSVVALLHGSYRRLPDMIVGLHLGPCLCMSSSRLIKRLRLCPGVPSTRWSLWLA